MNRNIEIKARVHDVAALVERARKVATEGPQTIEQTDVFFPTGQGRLKLRIFSPGRGELIHYDRPDQAGPKMSHYSISPTGDPAGLRAVLTAAYGEENIVRKVRVLYLAGRTRIHIDTVEGLGDFVELEVVLAQGERFEDGIEEAHTLMARLGIDPVDRIEGAYADLLKAAGL